MDKDDLLYRSYRELAVGLICRMRRQNDNGAEISSGNERMEDLMRICACLEEPETAEAFLRPLNRLNEAVRKADGTVAGTLETEAYPLVKAWLQSI